MELEDGYALTGRTESGSGKKAFLLKTDLNGKKLLEKTYGQESTGLSLNQINDSEFIIVGSIDSPVKGKSALLIKTDSTGKEQWIMPLGGPGEAMGTSVTERIDGGYVMAGITNSFRAGEEDAWLVKLMPGNIALNATSGNVMDIKAFPS